MYNGEMTAISQYCDFCFFPSLPPNKQAIQEQILRAFNQIKASGLPFQTCNMDFAVLEKETLVIEINPYVPPNYPRRLQRIMANNAPFPHRKPLPAPRSLIGVATSKY